MLGLLVMLMMLPETKGRSLEELSAFREGKGSRSSLKSKAKRFFFEKRTKKLLSMGVRSGGGAPENQSAKSFLVLFFKKEPLS